MMRGKKAIQRRASASLCETYFRHANTLAHDLSELERRLGGGLSEKEREALVKLSTVTDGVGQALRVLSHHLLKEPREDK